MLEVGRCLWQREYISGTSGNFSVRLDDDHILSTPSGLAKGRLTPNDLVVTDLEGTVVQGSHQPSSELRIHLAAYRLRPEIGAVVHAHPKTIVALSLASIDVMFTALPETVVALGLIGSAPYETPGSSALASVMESALENHDAIVMERHGAITLGRNLFEAYDRMETLEHAAQTLYLAQSLGSIEALPDDEIERLLALAH
jgi:L-fuculose-phosphate aldolase